jgi:hypothetical protein
MTDRAWVIVGAVLALVGLLASAVATRPRPRSLLEIAYLALPIAGAVVLIVFAWERV